MCDDLSILFISLFALKLLLGGCLRVLRRGGFDLVRLNGGLCSARLGVVHVVQLHQLLVVHLVMCRHLRMVRLLIRLQQLIWLLSVAELHFVRPSWSLLLLVGLWLL